MLSKLVLATAGMAAFRLQRPVVDLIGDLLRHRISSDDDTAMENLAHYIIRASFSQERMQYLDQEGTVVYTSKDGATTRNFPALEWLATMCSHIPNRGDTHIHA